MNSLRGFPGGYFALGDDGREGICRCALGFDPERGLV